MICQCYGFDLDRFRFRQKNTQQSWGNVVVAVLLRSGDLRYDHYSKRKNVVTGREQRG